MELQRSDPELNPFIDEDSMICGFVELCISGPRDYGRDCVVHVAEDNKWVCSFRHCQSLTTSTSTVIHLAKLKVKKRPFCKYASYLAQKWDLLIASPYCYFKSGLAANIHLSLEYSVWKKAGNFILKWRCTNLYPVLSCLFILCQQEQHSTL